MTRRIWPRSVLPEWSWRNLFPHSSAAGLVQLFPRAGGWLSWWEMIGKLKTVVHGEATIGKLSHSLVCRNLHGAYSKVNRLWFLEGKLHLCQSQFMCRLATFALGQGGLFEIATTSLVRFLPTATNLSETWGEFWCLWERNNHRAEQGPASSPLLQVSALAASFSKAYLSSALSLNF